MLRECIGEGKIINPGSWPDWLGHGVLSLERAEQAGGRCEKWETASLGCMGCVLDTWGFFNWYLDIKSCRKLVLFTYMSFKENYFFLPLLDLHCCAGFSLVAVKAAQSCPTLCDPTGYTVHGVLQARILQWVVVPFSGGSSQPRDLTQVSRVAGGFLTS